jgi:hypothetical protein
MLATLVRDPITVLRTVADALDRAADAAHAHWLALPINHELLQEAGATTGMKRGDRVHKRMNELGVVPRGIELPEWVCETVPVGHALLDQSHRVDDDGEFRTMTVGVYRQMVVEPVVTQSMRLAVQNQERDHSVLAPSELLRAAAALLRDIAARGCPLAATLAVVGLWCTGVVPLSTMAAELENGDRVFYAARPHRDLDDAFNGVRESADVAAEWYARLRFGVRV